MTENTFSAIGWCLLQVSLVAFIGIASSLLLARRRPLAASTVVCMAAVVCATLTFLAPLPAHLLFVVETRSALNDTIVRQPSPSVQNEGTSSIHAFQRIPMFDLQELTRAVRKLARTIDLSEKRESPVAQNAVWFLMALIAIGLMRLIAAIAFVANLRRKCARIADPQLAELLLEVALKFDHRKPLEIYENSDCTDAAVAGWFRPRLILPGEWREWTDDERRAVMAHEMAHIVGSTTNKVRGVSCCWE